LPVYLSFNKPFKLDAKLDGWDDLRFGLQGKKKFQDIETINEVAIRARELGYDSVIVKNVGDTGEGLRRVANTYIAFEPTQIKSLFNKGEFDPADPRITHQLRQMEKPEAKKSVKSRVLEAVGIKDTGKKVTLPEKQLLKEQIKAEARTAKVVAKTVERETREAIARDFKSKATSEGNIKKRLIKFAKTFIELKDRGKLLSTVRSAKTEADLGRAVDMMATVAEKTLRSGLRSQIKTELKKTKVKKVSGRPKGKFTPEIQETLDTMRNASRMSKESAETKLADNLSKGVVSAEMARENAILNMKANSDTMTSQELNQALKEIKSLKETGKLISEQGKADFKEDINKKKDDIKRVLTGTVGKEIAKQEGIPEPETRKDAGDSFKNRIITAGKSLSGWNDVLDILSFRDKTSTAFKSDLNKIAKVSNEETAEKKGNRIATEKINDIAKSVYDIKTDRQLVKKFIDDSKIYLTIGKLELTKAQARKRYMEFQDPTLNDTFTNMGYTDAIKQKIVDSLSKEDKAFADSQLEFYREYYKDTNVVYSQLNGVNLPKNDFYSPIRREDFGKEADAGDFLNEMKHRMSVAPGATKSRVSSRLPLAQLSDVDELARHMSEMEHYKAWGLKIRELNSIFNDPAIRATIKKQYGKETMGIVDGFIQDFTRGRIDTSKNFNWLDKLRINFTTSVLALKPALAVKQLVSIPAYAENIPTADFVKGVTSFFIYELLYPSSS